MKSVYSAVRTGSLNKAVCASSLKGLTSKHEPNYLNYDLYIFIKELKNNNLKYILYVL